MVVIPQEVLAPDPVTEEAALCQLPVSPVKRPGRPRRCVKRYDVMMRKQETGSAHSAASSESPNSLEHEQPDCSVPVTH